MSGDNSKFVETYVITGGTRGIGFGMARELLQRGQNVFLCGRTEESVQQAVDQLCAMPHGNSKEHVGGMACDICDIQSVQALWDGAMDKFSRVDVWINNAAISPHVPLLPPDDNDDNDEGTKQISQCIDSNIKGAIHCFRVAAKGMRKQSAADRSPRIYLMEGLGSDGSIRSSETMIYGCTKYAGSYLANAMEQELLSKTKTTMISLGRLSPGMVTTELLLGSLQNKQPAEMQKTKKILNILADKETTVTPWLADQLVAGNLTIRWLTPAGVVGRFVKSLFVSPSDLFDDEKETSDKSATGKKEVKETPTTESTTTAT